MVDGIISDAEVVCRRIPPTVPWFEPPDKITSANFKLDRRRNEQGVSVYRRSITSDRDILAKPDAKPGSLIAIATVGEIRQLTSGAGRPLHLDVVAVDDDKDPGHAEIRSPVAGEMPQAASKALKELFRLDRSV